MDTYSMELILIRGKSCPVITYFWPVLIMVYVNPI